MAKKNFGALGGVFSTKATTVKKLNKTSITVFESNYNYEGIKKEDIEELQFAEREIFQIGEAIKKNHFDIAKYLYEANEILANYDKTSGKFIEWFQGLDLKKTYVYNSINRYKLYLLSNNKEAVSKLTQKGVEILSNKKMDEDTKLTLLKNNEVIEKSDRELKEYVQDIISERSEMIKSVSENNGIEEAQIIEPVPSYTKKRAKEDLKNIKELLNNDKVDKEKLKKICQLISEVRDRVEEVVFE